MEFLKAHYEKIILSIVLLGLAAVAALMPVKISEEKEKEEARKKDTIGKTIKPYPPINISTNLEVLDRIEKPIVFRLAGDHNVFNPVRWQKKVDGTLVKRLTGAEVFRATVVSDIRPLNLRVSFEGVGGTPETPKYNVAQVKETDKTPRPAIRAAAKGEKNDLFSLPGIVGSPENPTALSIILKGEKDPVVVARDKPFERVIGYTADIKNTLDDKAARKNLRVKDEIIIDGEPYIIVAINQNGVVLSAKSNKKQSLLEFKPESK